MKFILSLFLFSFSCFAQNNDLELIVVKNDSSYIEIDFTLKIRNNSKKTVRLLKAIDISFMNIGYAPNVEFVTETNVNGEWKKFKDPKIKNIDYWLPEINQIIIEIKPNEEAFIGKFFRSGDLSSWFTFLDDAKIRLHFIYKILVDSENIKEAKELKENNIEPITLTSNYIEYEHQNYLTKKEYLKLKQFYINSEFSKYIEEKYTSKELLSKIKKIQNENCEIEDILVEVQKKDRFEYVSHFVGLTKDGFKYTGILYKSKNKLCLGIYSGKHHFSKEKDVKLPLEYYFGEIDYDSEILNNYLYQN